jgi:hypothetical protein
MAHIPDLESIESLVVANTIQFDTMYRLLVDKGYFTESEFHEKLKKVEADYQGKASDLH